MNDLLQFLEELEANNRKDWMDANRDWYLRVKSAFIQLVTELLERMIELEPGMAALQPKDCVFRQNRDIRFSANKSPYKNNMAAYFAVGGKKSDGPGYYLHIQPGASFLGGGIYHPSPEVLKKIRLEIDYSGEELASILGKPTFREKFGELTGERLKTAPRDYAADHPYIHWLRMKSFEAGRALSDHELKSEKLIKLIMEHFREMKPFNDFMAKAVDESEGGYGLLS